MSINFTFSAFILRCKYSLLQASSSWLKIKKSEGGSLSYSASHNKNLRFTAHKKLG